jgi:hypothetical protein
MRDWHPLMLLALCAVGASLLLTPITTVILWLLDTDAGSRPLTEYFFSRDYLYLVLLKTALFFAIFIIAGAADKAVDAVWSWVRRVVSTD